MNYDYENLERRVADIEADLHGSGKYVGELIGGNLRAITGKVGYLTALFYLPGLVLSMILSWSTNQSILWAIIHGYLSWIYIVYYVFF